MNCLAITDDGKLCVSDYRSIYRAILEVLYNGPMRIIDLVKRIRSEYHEFKFLGEKVIINALGELSKQKLIVSKYEEDY